MADLCIPVPHLEDTKIAEVEVKINGVKTRYNFRLESFPWKSESDEAQGADYISELENNIHLLKESITKYDENWELIQIYKPKENANSIQVLFRKKDII